MNSVPKPQPLNRTIEQDLSGINFISKVHDGVAYWGIRHISKSNELVEEHKGSMPLYDIENLKKLGRIVKEFSTETGLPIRYSGSQDKYEGYGLERDSILVLSEEGKLERLVEAELRSAYSLVEIYTDASWSMTGSVYKRVGYGWCSRYGYAGRLGNGTYSKIHQRFAERYALVEGIRSNYQNIYKYGGSDSKIVVHTDMLYDRDWAEKKINGNVLKFDELPDNDLYQFFTKAIKRSIDKTGPKLEFVWVKGHSTDVWNDTADKLAVNARTSKGSYVKIEESFYRNVRAEAPVSRD